MRIGTRRDVIVWSGVITALAVAVPTLLLFPFVMHLPWRYILIFLASTAGIPLLIALPISLFALHLVHLLSTTIDRVDRLVKFDPLTGLMSRSYFMDAARKMPPPGAA